MAQKLGDVYYELGVETKKFASGLGKAKSKAKQVGKAVAKAFAAVTVAVGAISTALMKVTLDTIKYGVKIDKISKVIGMTAENVSALTYAMEQEHGSAEGLEKGLMNLTTKLGYAGQGLESYTRYFEQLGIEYKNQDGTLRNTYEVFEDLTDIMSRGEVSTENMSAAMMLLGTRASKEMIPFMKLGKEEIHKLMREAKKLGLVLSDETAAALKKTDDAITKLKGALRGMKIEIGTRLAPALKGYADTMAESFMLMREQLTMTYPALTKTGEATETLEKKGVSFALSTTKIIFQIRKAWIQLKLGVQGVLNGMVWMSWKSNEVLKKLYDINYQVFHGMAKVWDKIFKTDLANILESGKKNIESNTENMRLAFEEGEIIMGEYFDQYALLEAQEIRTLDRLKRITEQQTELNKKRTEGTEIPATKLVDEGEVKRSEDIIESLVKFRGMSAEEELDRRAEEMTGTVDIMKKKNKDFQNNLDETIGKTIDLTTAASQFGSVMAEAFKKGELEADKLLETIFQIALQIAGTAIGGPLGGMVGSFVGGLFEEGGVATRKGIAGYGMQEGGVTVENKTTMSPQGNIFAEKGTEIFMQGEQFSSFLEALQGNTFIIHNASPLTYIEELKKANKGEKQELARFMDEKVLSERKEIR